MKTPKKNVEIFILSNFVFIVYYFWQAFIYRNHSKTIQCYILTSHMRRFNLLTSKNYSNRDHFATNFRSSLSIINASICNYNNFVNRMAGFMLKISYNSYWNFCSLYPCDLDQYELRIRFSWLISISK